MGSRGGIRDTVPGAPARRDAGRAGALRLSA